MNKQQLVALALTQIRRRRADALDKCDKTLEKLRSHADWVDNEHKLRVATVKEVMSNSDSDKTAAKKEIDACMKVQKCLLDKYKVTQSMLKPHFTCSKCQDTGYVDGNPCDCLQTEIRRLLIDECDIPHPEYTSANSTETNAHNLKVYARAEQICSSDKGNILLLGNVGLGKTYLLTACANKCVSLGKSVMYTTAYGLNQTFLECHLSDLATKEAILGNLAEVDVLCIDDLGTEPTYKNVSAEYLFSVLNERLTTGKQNFITTNLSIAQLRDTYDERIFSRIVDKQGNLVAQLSGNDKRLN